MLLPLIRTGIETIVLRPDADGFAQLCEIFSQRQGLERLHWFAAETGDRGFGAAAVEAARRGLDWRAAFAAQAEVLVHADRPLSETERTALFAALESTTGVAAIAMPMPGSCRAPILVSDDAEPPTDGPLDPGDYRALRSLHHKTDGDNWTRCANWDVASTAPPAASAVARWYGVTVVGNRVTTLALPSTNLRGQLPSALGNLICLSELQLGGNQLRGNIPATLGKLSRLTELDLSGNTFSGAIPAALGGLRRLLHLSLSVNKLSGTIPAALGRMSNLRSLYLCGNRLVGPIPSELGQLSHLQNLYLNGNALSGAIPAALGDLSQLEYLSLASNRLDGTIPAALGQLSSLQSLYLHGNRLSGLAPPQLDRLPCLHEVSLDGSASCT